MEKRASFHIDLSSTAFDPTQLADLLGDEGPTSDVVHDGRWVRLPCFGLVVIGLDRIIDNRWREEIVQTTKMVSPHVAGPVFECPLDWKLSHLVKAFGLFKSVGEARRNGWDRDIPTGFQPNVFRINRIKGVLWTCKPDAAFMNQTASWSTDDD